MRQHFTSYPVRSLENTTDGGRESVFLWVLLWIRTWNVGDNPITTQEEVYGQNLMLTQLPWWPWALLPQSKKAPCWGLCLAKVFLCGVCKFSPMSALGFPWLLRLPPTKRCSWWFDWPHICLFFSMWWPCDLSSWDWPQLPPLSSKEYAVQIMDGWMLSHKWRFGRETLQQIIHYP